MKKVFAILVTAFSVMSASQVRVTVPRRHYMAHDKIDVEILNGGSNDVTLCVEFGYTSFADYSSNGEATPTPVYIQQKLGHAWKNLVDGPDIGSAIAPLVLRSGESQCYPFRVSTRGTVRLGVLYFVGSSGHSCADRKGPRRALSRHFEIE